MPSKRTRAVVRQQPKKARRKPIPGQFAELSLEEQVRRARPFARAKVVQGVDPQNWFADDGLDTTTMMAIVKAMVGHEGPNEGDGDELVLQELEDYGAVAYALGGAVGQLLPPAAIGGR